MILIDTFILNNNINNLIIVFSLIVFVSFTRRILSRYIASLLFIPIKKKWKSVEKNEFINLIINPLASFLAVLISVIIIDNLVFPEAWKISIYGISFRAILHKLGICITLLFFIWIVQSFIDFIALVLDINAKQTKDKSDDQVIVFFRDFFKVIAYIAGVLLILKAGFDVNIGSVFTGLSIVGAALALAAKESIENLIASFIIFFDKPFYTGDIVKVNTINGTIENIGLRSTRIRTIDQTLVTVPNKQMVDSVVDNWSMRNGRRAEINIELDNSTSTLLIEHLIRDVKLYLEEKSPTIISFSVFLSDYNKNALIVNITFQTTSLSIDDFAKLKQEVNLQIKFLIEDHKIKLGKADTEK